MKKITNKFLWIFAVGQFAPCKCAKCAQQGEAPQRKPVRAGFR